LPFEVDSEYIINSLFELPTTSQFPKYEILIEVIECAIEIVWACKNELSDCFLRILILVGPPKTALLLLISHTLNVSVWGIFNVEWLLIASLVYIWAVGADVLVTQKYLASGDIAKKFIPDKLSSWFAEFEILVKLVVVANL